MKVESTGKFPEMKVKGNIHEVDDATGKILIEMGAAIEVVEEQQKPKDKAKK